MTSISDAIACLRPRSLSSAVAPMCFVTAILGLVGCAKQQAAPPPTAAVSVVVGKVSQDTVPVQITAIGNVEAYSTVSIKAQVSGELVGVHFTEGDFVHKGQL